MPKILVIDDDPEVRKVVSRALALAGMSVVEAASGRQGQDQVEAERPDVVILDLKLPDISGQEICARLRRHPASKTVPILVLTGSGARGRPAELINWGADDFVAKPCNMDELTARVRSLLRRPSYYHGASDVLKNGPLAIEVSARKVSAFRKPVPHLAPKEFELLRCLVSFAPRVLDKETLAVHVWGMPSQDLHPRTLDVHARRIRQKLGPEAGRWLKNIPGVGYQWDTP